MSFIAAIIANLTSNLIQNSIDIVSKDISNNVKWKKWKAKHSLNKNQSDFLDRYAETLVSLKKENKPDDLLLFYSQEAVINTIHTVWYQNIKQERFVPQFKQLTKWFTLEERLENFSAKDELTHFLKSFENSVNLNRTAGEVEVVKKLDSMQKILESLITKESTNHIEKKVNNSSSVKKQKSRRKSVTPPSSILIEQVAKGKVIPLIGAGLSISALSESETSFKMPNYSELLELLILEAKKNITNDDLIDKDRIKSIRDCIKRGDIDDATRILTEKVISGYHFYRGIRKILNPLDKDLRPSPAHNLLKTLGFRLLITTNYDRLLEKFVGTGHEVITPVDTEAFKLLRENINDSYSLEKYILKLHGDITRPDTIAFGGTKLEELYRPSRQGENNLFYKFLEEIFQHRIILFLGCSFDPSVNEGQIKFLRNLLKNLYAGKPFQKHYALVEYKGDKVKAWRNEVEKETGIKFIEYFPDEEHSQVWEFISYLNKAKTDEPELGKKWSQWYRAKEERGDYLARQLSFEQKAQSIRFLTPKLTNAIATKEHLDIIAAQELISQDYHENDVKAKIIPNMFARFYNLEKRLKEDDLEVRVMFLKSSLETDLKKPDSIIIQRYEHLLSMLDNSNYDVEVRLLEELFSNYLKKKEASYAIIFSNIPKPNADVVIAYASQATTDYFKIHAIQQNTEETGKKIIQFERYWASALSEQESRNYIEKLLKNAKNQ